jgi:hypothetical protein
MVIKKDTVERIREIISRGFNRLSIVVVGPENVSAPVINQFSDIQSQSLPDVAYYHNYLNEQGKEGNPETLEEMISQQGRPGVLPRGNAHEFATDSLNSNLYQLIQKHKAEVEAQVIGIIRDNNSRYRNNALQNLDRPDELDAQVKEQTLDELKERIQEYLGVSSQKDWERIVNTEISNAIGNGSVDAVVARNKKSDPNDIYVYRINPDDGRTCKYCRNFYIDGDGSPRIFTLSRLLSNGTNYGKKADSWLPVAGATHPNCRDSQIIELRPGWAVKPGGSVTYIGMDKWREYLLSKLTS